jgi:hypothetical protein
VTGGQVLVRTFLHQQQRITDVIVAGTLTMLATEILPTEQILEAATLQARRLVHGKVVIAL